MSKKTQSATAPKWDAVYDNDQADIHIKARVKVFTARDGMGKRSLEIKLAQRFPDEPADAEATERDAEDLYLVNNYPLLRFGIKEAVGFDLPLSEEGFWSLPEAFMLTLSEAIRKANPQYTLDFLSLRRLIEMASARNTEQTTTDTPPSAESAKTD